MAKKFEFVIESEDKTEGIVETVRLRLQESNHADDGIDLVTVDSAGDLELYILTLDEDGVIHMHGGNNIAGHKDEDGDESDHLTVEFD